MFNFKCHLLKQNEIAIRRRFSVMVVVSLLLSCIYEYVYFDKCQFVGVGSRLGPCIFTADSPVHHIMHQATLMKSNGSLWYRIGEPFDPVPVDSIVVVFSPSLLSPGDDQDVEQVLVFGQSIAGLFHNDKRSFVLATVSNSSIVVRLRYTSKSQSHTRYWESLLPGSMTLDNDEQFGRRRVWYRLVVCTSCLQIGEIALIQPPEKHPNSNQSVLLEGVPMERGSASLRSLLRGFARQNASGITIDSGLYVAGVVDSRTAFGTEKIKTFKGLIAASLCKSSSCIEVASTVTTQGVNIESYKSYLNANIGPALASPLKIERTRTTTAPRPYVFRFPVVTAVSDNHAKEVEAMLTTARNVMPNRGIVVYNLGLNAPNLKRLRSLCGVIVREFPIHLYPDTIKDLFKYRWKPLVVFAALHEFGGAAWADASIRFKEKIDTVPSFHYGHGFVGFQQLSASPVGAFTHDTTLKSLGVQRSRVAKSLMTITGIHIWLSGHKTSRTLLDHWSMCAFHPQCMAPTGAQRRGCKFKLGMSNYIQCHRYDQSAISVILEKMFPANSQEYITNEVLDMKRILDINRRPDPNITACVRNKNDSKPPGSIAWVP